MRLGLSLSGDALSLDQITSHARHAEAAGFESAWTVERSRSALVPAVMIGLRTRTLRVGTGIALAFPRSPATLALEALDAAEALNGRFVLGLGAGPRDTVERWHGVPGDRPARRMREYLEALRLILRAEDGEDIRYRGELIATEGVATRSASPSHVLPIYLAAVNVAMLRVAGGFADGWIGARITSPGYLREVLLPEIARGAARRGRARRPDTASLLLTSVAPTRAVAVERACATLAYTSRLAYYDAAFEFHGLTRAVAAIREAYRQGGLPAAAKAVPEPMLDALAIVGTAGECRERLGRYDGLLDAAILAPPTAGLAREAVDDAHDAVIDAFSGWRHRGEKHSTTKMS